MEHEVPLHSYPSSQSIVGTNVGVDVGGLLTEVVGTDETDGRDDGSEVGSGVGSEVGSGVGSGVGSMVGLQV